MTEKFSAIVHLSAVVKSLTFSKPPPVFGYAPSAGGWFCGNILFPFLCWVDGPDRWNPNSPTDGKPQRYMQAMHSTKIITLIFLINLGIFSSCKQKKHSLIEDVLIDNGIAQQSDSLRAAIALNQLVYEIKATSEIESSYIGYEGRKSNQRNFAMLLSKWATIDQLINLTNNGSPTVRLFAFEALQINNYPKLKEIFEQHLFDKQTYTLHSGCSIYDIPVNIAFYNQISSSLNPIELKPFKDSLLKQYKNTCFEFMASF